MSNIGNTVSHVRKIKLKLENLSEKDLKDKKEIEKILNNIKMKFKFTKHHLILRNSKKVSIEEFKLKNNKIFISSNREIKSKSLKIKYEDGKIIKVFNFINFEFNFRILKNLKCAVICSGGDAPGMNIFLYNFIEKSINSGVQIMLINAGYEGLMNLKDNEFLKMNENERSEKEKKFFTQLKKEKYLGGTILRSSRSVLFTQKEGRLRAIFWILVKKTSFLVVIGGDGSITGLSTLKDEYFGGCLLILSFSFFLHKKNFPETDFGDFFSIENIFKAASYSENELFTIESAKELLNSLFGQIKAEETLQMAKLYRDLIKCYNKKYKDCNKTINLLKFSKTFIHNAHKTDLSFKLNCIAVPATIDNDIPSTISLGHISAMAVIYSSVKILEPTMSSHSRRVAVEVMGRKCGSLTASSKICMNEKSICFLPEHNNMFWRERLVEWLSKEKNNKDFLVIFVTEGTEYVVFENPEKKEMSLEEVYLKIKENFSIQNKEIDQKKDLNSSEENLIKLFGNALHSNSHLLKVLELLNKNAKGNQYLLLRHKLSVNMMQKFINTEIKQETRDIVLGHLQRGGDPSAFDRLLGFQMASKSIDNILGNKSSGVLCFDKMRVKFEKFNAIISKIKEIKKAEKLFSWKKVIELREKILLNIVWEKVNNRELEIMNEKIFKIERNKKIKDKTEKILIIFEGNFNISAVDFLLEFANYANIFCLNYDKKIEKIENLLKFKPTIHNFSKKEIKKLSSEIKNKEIKKTILIGTVKCLELIPKISNSIFIPIAGNISKKEYKFLCEKINIRKNEDFLYFLNTDSYLGTGISLIKSLLLTKKNKLDCFVVKLPKFLIPVMEKTFVDPCIKFIAESKAFCCQIKKKDKTNYHEVDLSKMVFGSVCNVFDSFVAKSIAIRLKGIENFEGNQICLYNGNEINFANI